MQLLQQLNRSFETSDTPRGLVITISDSGFRNAALNGDVVAKLAGVSALLAAHPDLAVKVDGRGVWDAAGRDMSWQRAEAVRDALVHAGAAQRAITARGLGNERPLVSNSSANGRWQNRRVEITISGDSIGSVPYWDRTYSLK